MVNTENIQSNEKKPSENFLTPLGEWLNSFDITHKDKVLNTLWQLRNRTEETEDEDNTQLSYQLATEISTQ